MSLGFHFFFFFSFFILVFLNFTHV
jgi:hypothetical protein